MNLGPLTGLRVLDLSRMVSGPLCGRMLADLGADVVKVEPPDRDRTSTVPPLVHGVSPYYAQMNAGKRNVCVDLKAPGGSEVVARLAAGADVFLENFRPGVLERYDLDADSLLAANPRLVYCSVTGWGQSGPWRDHRAFAPLVHADIGTLELAARHRDRRPEPEIHQHGDVYPAVVATSAVLAALLARVTTGRGDHLDVAMGQAAFYVNDWAATDLQPAVDDFGGFDTWNQYTYRLGDGSYVALVGNPVNLFPLWVRSLGGDDALLTDTRFVTPAARASARRGDESGHGRADRPIPGLRRARGSHGRPVDAHGTGSVHRGVRNHRLGDRTRTHVGSCAWNSRASGTLAVERDHYRLPNECVGSGR